MCIDESIEHNHLTVAPDTLLTSAIALMNQQQAGIARYVLVVAAGQLKGILTCSDLVKAIANKLELTTTKVDRVMSQPVITIARSQLSNIESVWSLMQKHSISYLPILSDEGTVLGVIDARILTNFKPASSVNLRSLEVSPPGDARSAKVREDNWQEGKTRDIRTIFLACS